MNSRVGSVSKMIVIVSVCLLVGSNAVAEESALDEKRVPTFLTSDEDPRTRDYWPTFSPDGKVVLFSRRPRPRAKWELFVVSVTGGDARRLIDSSIPVSATRANWSPTGRIAFAGASRNRQQHLWLVNSDGSDPQRITIPGLSNRVSYPSWYSDGQRLVVIDRGKQILQRVDLKNKNAVPITKQVEFLVGMPSVSPDGRLVAFAGQKNKGAEYDQTKNSICIIDGGTARTVEDEPKQGRTPNWSPNGRWIAFESNRGSPNRRYYAIFIMNKDGKHLRRLTPYSWRANHPVWSPSGTKMAFSAVHPSRPGVSGIAIIDLNIDEGSEE